MSFNKSLEGYYRRNISSMLGIKGVRSHDKYLGLPTVFLRSKRFSFANLRGRIWKKIKGWKEKLLSKTGKEVLIKAVAQSIPTYAMSCFKLPSSFCNEVTSIIRNFWWGTTNLERGIPWKAWKKICRSKCEGGLGFRNLENFNSTLLGKQFCRLHCYPSSLLARVLKSRYFTDSSIRKAKVGVNPSYGWRSIWSSRDILVKGSRWSIGNGNSIRIWDNAWLVGSWDGKIFSPNKGVLADTNVNFLIDPTTHS